MYHFKEVVLKNEAIERKVLVIEFDDPKMGIVGEFLMADSSLLDYSVLGDIDKVLSGDCDYIETAGNRCSLEVRCENTLIADLLEGLFDDFETFPAYEINTQELRDLIVIWKGKAAAFIE